jgi:hypothetical protein
VVLLELLPGREFGSLRETRHRDGFASRKPIAEIACVSAGKLSTGEN